MPPPPLPPGAEGAPKAESTIEEVGLDGLAGLAAQAAQAPKHRATTPKPSPTASQYLDRPPGTPSLEAPPKLVDVAKPRAKPSGGAAPRDKTPVDGTPPPERAAGAEDGGDEAPPKMPVAIIAAAAVLIFGMVIGSGVLVYKLATRGGDGGKVAAGTKSKGGKPAKVQSFKSSLSLFIGRSDALFAAVRGGEFPEEAVPLVVTSDAIAIRTEDLLQLEEGRVQRRDRKGLLVPPVVRPLMAELTDRTDSVGPMGRGSGALLILAEASVPFETIARLLYTAQAAGFRRLFLGGVSEENSRVASALTVEGPEWWPLAPNNAGNGLAVVADSAEGFRIFRRDGQPLMVNGNERPEMKIAKGVEFRIDKLSERLISLQADVGGRTIIVQPDKRVPYEAVLAMISAARGESGDLFEHAMLGGGGVL